ncbi:protein YgfX [Biostraticola tofi]|uniref:Toxin CptA n=1 Tax=Biostraticola tofi TaxID=466109 RepID=A0A4R3YI03_9GAMM|nr:protein YgfX [Biostraticola tofi]TCV91711.1 toxin CptA [Biostraticola tofi]
MALWRCDLRVSWRSQIFSLAAHGILLLLILLSPWPENYGPLWLTLVLLVVFECIRSQRSIMACRGELILTGERRLNWHGQEWGLTRQAWMLKGGMLLSLRQVDSGKKRRLWLAADSMDKEEWRSLRHILLNQPTRTSDLD